MDQLNIGIDGAKKAYMFKTFNPRDLRELTNSLRKKGIPVCSGNEGYWLAGNKNELEHTKNMVNSRIRELMEVANGLKTVKFFDV